MSVLSFDNVTMLLCAAAMVNCIRTGLMQSQDFFSLVLLQLQEGGLVSLTSLWAHVEVASCLEFLASLSLHIAVLLMSITRVRWFRHGGREVLFVALRLVPKTWGIVRLMYGSPFHVGTTAVRSPAEGAAMLCWSSLTYAIPLKWHLPMILVECLLLVLRLRFGGIAVVGIRPVLQLFFGLAAPTVALWCVQDRVGASQIRVLTHEKGGRFSLFRGKRASPKSLPDEDMVVAPSTSGFVPEGTPGSSGKEDSIGVSMLHAEERAREEPVSSGTPDSVPVEDDTLTAEASSTQVVPDAPAPHIAVSPVLRRPPQRLRVPYKHRRNSAMAPEDICQGLSDILQDPDMRRNLPEYLNCMLQSLQNIQVGELVKYRSYQSRCAYEQVSVKVHEESQDFDGISGDMRMRLRVLVQHHLHGLGRLGVVQSVCVSGCVHLLGSVMALVDGQADRVDESEEEASEANASLQVGEVDQLHVRILHDMQRFVCSEAPHGPVDLSIGHMHSHVQLGTSRLNGLPDARDLPVLGHTTGDSHSSAGGYREWAGGQHRGSHSFGSGGTSGGGAGGGNEGPSRGGHSGNGEDPHRRSLGGPAAGGVLARGAGNGCICAYPPCIAEGQPNEVTLFTSCNLGLNYRVVVNKAGTVVLDTSGVSENGSIKLSMPALGKGVLHITVLEGSSVQFGHPILVLPAEAAHEMEELWASALMEIISGGQEDDGADQGDELDDIFGQLEVDMQMGEDQGDVDAAFAPSSSESTPMLVSAQQLRTAWQEYFQPFMVDVSFLLGLAEQPVGKYSVALRSIGIYFGRAPLAPDYRLSEAERSEAEGVKNLVVHVVRFLSSNRMWAFLRFMLSVLYGENGEGQDALTAAIPDDSPYWDALAALNHYAGQEADDVPFDRSLKDSPYEMYAELPHVHPDGVYRWARMEPHGPLGQASDQAASGWHPLPSVDHVPAQGSLPLRVMPEMLQVGPSTLVVGPGTLPEHTGAAIQAAARIVSEGTMRHEAVTGSLRVLDMASSGHHSGHGTLPVAETMQISARVPPPAQETTQPDIPDSGTPTDTGHRQIGSEEFIQDVCELTHAAGHERETSTSDPSRVSVEQLPNHIAMSSVQNLVLEAQLASENRELCHTALSRIPGERGQYTKPRWQHMRRALVVFSGFVPLEAEGRYHSYRSERLRTFDVLTAWYNLVMLFTPPGKLLRWAWSNSMMPLYVVFQLTGVILYTALVNLDTVRLQREYLVLVVEMMVLVGGAVAGMQRYAVTAMERCALALALYRLTLGPIWRLSRHVSCVHVALLTLVEFGFLMMNYEGLANGQLSLTLGVCLGITVAFWVDLAARRSFLKTGDKCKETSWETNKSMRSAVCSAGPSLEGETSSG